VKLIKQIFMVLVLLCATQAFAAASHSENRGDRNITGPLSRRGSPGCSLTCFLHSSDPLESIDGRFADHPRARDPRKTSALNDLVSVWHAFVLGSHHPGFTNYVRDESSAGRFNWPVRRHVLTFI